MMPREAVNLTNTPGIYYSIAYFISSCLYISMNERRGSIKRTVGIQSLIFVVLTAFICLTDQINVIFFIPCMAVEVFIIGLSLYLCCKMNRKKAAYFCVRAFILGELAASLNWQLFYYGLNNWNVELNLMWSTIFVMSSYGAVYFIMYLLEKSYRRENAGLDITGRDLRICLFIGLLVYLMSNMSYIFENTPFSGQLPGEIFIIRTLVDLGGVGILFAYHMQLQEVKTKVENEFLSNTLRMQYENYKLSEESVALVNQKYHDLKHQIAILRATATEEEKDAYLDQMEHEIKCYEAQNKTGNRILDTILTAKTIQCQSHGISLTCVADGKELEFMQPMDISALFGNALDNAIESVKKISDRQKRLIHVSVARQKNFLRIKVENCYEGDLEFENGMPKTTKQDKRYHGYGMKSIRKIVEKYNGSVTVNAEDGWFELRILMVVG